MALILVVEDDRPLRDTVSEVLTVHGHQVLAAADGDAALNLLEQATSDAILLDLYLPIVDGRRFMQAYRRTPGPHAPILVMAGAGYAAERAAALDVAGFLDKPFDLSELFAKVEEVLGPSTQQGGTSTPDPV